MAGMGKRVARAMARRAASGDVYALSAIVEMQEALEAALVEGARGAHSFGYSWTDVAPPTVPEDDGGRCGRIRPGW